MKNKKYSLIVLVVLNILICINMILKPDIFTICSSVLIIFALLYIYIKNKLIVTISLYMVTFFATILSIIAESFNGSGFLLFYFYFLILTLCIMIKFNHKFEIALPVTVSILITFFIVIGLFDLLNYSYLFLIAIGVLCVLYVLKNKKIFNEKIDSINSKSFIIITLLFVASILSGFGRYVTKWDEYSYWGYAAKVLINTHSLREMLSYVGTMNTYPPVSSIWHYIVSVFVGYSESNLYIGLTFLSFIFIMPVFIRIEKNKNTFLFLLILASVGFPLLLNGSISYDTGT